MGMKVGLMGGTFDPIHIGHLVAAECAAETAGLDEVWFMPTNVPPHKDRAPGATPKQRLEMVRLATDGHPKFRTSDIELAKGGISYSVETVSLLKQRYPEHSFYYIIGADMIRYLPKWYKIEELVRMVRFIGLNRPGYEPDLAEADELVRQAVQLAEMPPIDLSSTCIRSRSASALSIRYLVPDRVREYIEVNRIYET